MILIKCLQTLLAAVLALQFRFNLVSQYVFPSDTGCLYSNVYTQKGEWPLVACCAKLGWAKKNKSVQIYSASIKGV